MKTSLLVLFAYVGLIGALVLIVLMLAAAAALFRAASIVDPETPTEDA